MHFTSDRLERLQRSLTVALNQEWPQLIHCLATKNANLRRTRDLLLPRLLSGQVELETNEVGA
jgi:hypothetical protein